MDPSLRIITQFPLVELFDEHGPRQARRLGSCGKNQVQTLLTTDRIQFVVAEVGIKPVWISRSKTFSFWKSEVVKHLADPDDKVELARFPGQYFYIASEWIEAENSRIVLLECHH